MSIADKLTTIAENEQKVYDKGKADGIETEYDRFWDIYQSAKNGTLNYSYAFSGYRWKAGSTFKPKYNIVTSNAAAMFQFFNAGSSDIAVDMVEYLDGLGVTLDFSNSTIFTSTFASAKIKRLGNIDVRSGTSGTFGSMFATTHLITIDKLIVKEATTLPSNVFSSAESLTNLTIEGVIGRSISFANNPLSVDSMKSIISALKNYAGTTSEDTYRLTFSSTCWENLEADSTAPDGNTWKDYVASLGWLYS